MIKIRPSKKADTRTANGTVTKDELLSDTKSHISDVQKGCAFFADILNKAGSNHDHTKTEYIDMFYDDFTTGLQGKDFKALDWWQIHKTERHHLNDSVPDDVNLIDVIEMIVDGVMAGMARSGNVYDITIPEEVLNKAVQNTQKLLQDNVSVTDKSLWWG